MAMPLALILAACSGGGEDEAEAVSTEQGVVDPLDTSNRAELSDREVSERFIEIFYNQNRLVEGFEAWVHPDYIQHDPNSPTGRDATIAVLAAHMERNPQMTHDVKRTIYGEDDQGRTLVAVHYHFKRAPDDRGSAVVDIYRIENGYLVEHWDVIQPVPETALNDNTMF
ncbi:nuclear transport factor 2 family protein [Alteraurantiacibacter palmitatis]|uniref:Nuclear transport factor 2 family protein n=1 Tax=Alteraurantiacibacter palmitatis TaxID=2054628 RepID=A0ABV7E3S4_9SPHN